MSAHTELATRAAHAMLAFEAWQRSDQCFNGAVYRAASADELIAAETRGDTKAWASVAQEACDIAEKLRGGTASIQRSRRNREAAERKVAA
jgi:hypothetical protein